ncbi:MAG: bifunctional 5,10-methylenetetrahydrofolate dehydrogenase/5,10-methenyltetrahydrofolate cyclohydrolase [Acidobacteria bacterium]|jgi:methylenetetrahydrofolate dehydrogenase (NADP+) / methenyltetrahydrofolate cyclohydrolase|nr:bifunctional 5,10-methylenetetrahydrofolate dehydrogenase/5,10-methenyltetrahydrofolate cyclohydrolase [Acidobacteriota bacterium]
MSAERLDGAGVAKIIRAEVAPQVAQFQSTRGRKPGLHILLVGDDPASQIYVRNKERAGAEAGLIVSVHRLTADVTLDDVLAAVRRLNADPACDGILVQAPLPRAIGKDGTAQVFDAIDPRKDVDGFHPHNVGLLVQGRAALKPCTPSGVIELLDRTGHAIAGTHAVVIGRSEIVGKPMALLLLQRDATVTICHSKTPDLKATCRGADILVAAIGRPGFVTPDFVKPGAVVVDVGINRVDTRETAVSLFGADHPRIADFDKRGSLVVGDVHPSVETVAGAMTPVPGGVGPLTIAMLLKNTLAAAKARG